MYCIVATAAGGNLPPVTLYIDVSLEFWRSYSDAGVNRLSLACDLRNIDAAHARLARLYRDADMATYRDTIYELLAFVSRLRVQRRLRDCCIVDVKATRRN